MAASPQVNATSSIVDDRDPRFTYSGVWRLAGSLPEFNSTTHGSNATGSTAVLTFNGTSLLLYGTISPTDENGPPVSSYSIDDGTATVYTAPTTNSTLFQQIFYETYGLEAGKHTLTVTVKSTHPSEYWLDYALICNENTSGTNSTKSNSNSGAIVSGVLGGILFLLAAGLLLWWHRRRRLSRGIKIASVTHRFVLQPDIDANQAEMSSASLPRSKTNQAVSMPQLDRGPSSPGTSSCSSFPHTSAYGGPELAANHALAPTSVSLSLPHIRTTYITSNPAPLAHSSDDQSPSDQSPSNPSRPSRRKGVPRPPPPPTPAAPRLHEDGGVRLGGGRLNDPETMIDIPPVYREY